MPNSKSITQKQKSKAATTIGHRREAYESCGNIFRDMGKSEDESNNLMMRSRLMIEIEQSIKRHDWTQAKAAKVIGTAQPRIAELFAGRIDLFTLDTLIKYLNKLGRKVTLVVVQDREVA